ncbi:Flagellar motor switch protein FliM [Pseudobythopirellula maris]|uniref:Flagellar motor switch protein FliM n=1 Tax=Pseudobythopirellula maris TaxID=2527991 RepID=A0A5C5ZN34_9BACT|nr:flagellar motor switch protein FliM [Pseudobythopirellula maris]TWT88387.1 Flagellar motor switch protein FliM [Pseudobythopirellula maris]
MSDVLNQNEIESLLGSLDTGPADPAPAAAPSNPGKSAAKSVAAFSQSQGASGIAELPKPKEKVTPYDFKRPERVGKDQMRALQTMHEGFGRNFGAALSSLLRSIVEVKLTSVDQLTYSEFVFSLENPTCFNLVNAKPLEGQLILDINPSLLYPIIDRLLGGTGEANASTRRPLTEIELLLVGRITGLFLDEMRAAWENVIELELSVERVESNPQLVQIVPPNEVVVLVSFELTLGEVRGMMNLCIPFNTIERIGSKLSANSWITYSKKPPTPETRQNISDQMSGSIVEVVVDLAETRIATKDLIGLRVGDVINTEKDKSTPLVVSVEGRRKFHASPGALKGHKAIQVIEALEERRQAAGDAKEA